jgi:peroxiredoxin
MDILISLYFLAEWAIMMQSGAPAKSGIHATFRGCRWGSIMSDTPQESTNGKPPTRWASTLVPLVPIVLAVVVAIIASRYGDSRDSVEHLSGPDVGSPAPDFTLPDAQGGPVKLSSVTAEKAVLLVFYLGYDCPRCVRHLRELADHSAEFEKANVKILAIGPDTVEKSQAAIKQFGGFPFPVLSDPHRRVAKAYGLTLTDNRLLHGVFIVDRQNQIRFAVRSDRPYDNITSLIARVRE